MRAVLRMSARLGGRGVFHSTRFVSYDLMYRMSLDEGSSCGMYARCDHDQLCRERLEAEIKELEEINRRKRDEIVAERANVKK